MVTAIVVYFCVCVFVCLWTQAHVPRYATVRQERTVCASILCALPSHGMLCAHPFHHFHLRAAPQGLPSPQPGSRRHSPHRYLGGDLALFLHRVRILPISEIKDGSSQESVLLKKLLALSTKYSGSEFPTDQDLLGLVRVSWMCTTLGQRMMCNCGIPAAPCAPAEFWTSSKHTVASNLHQGRLASKIPNLSTLLLCKNGC